MWREEPAWARAVEDRLFTFTSCFEREAFDEREYAMAIARVVGVRPHLVFPTRPGRRRGVRRLRQVGYAYLVPLLRSGRLPTAAAALAGMPGQGDRYVLNIVVQRVDLDEIVFDALPQPLRMEDRSSMAFSLEARVPLLDHHMVQLGVFLPDNLRLNHGGSKSAIRQATEGIMPDSVRWRSSKLRFAAPDRAGLMEDLRDRIEDLLSGQMRSVRYVTQHVLRRWYRESPPAQPNTESSLGLFRILSLEMWIRAFGS